MKLRMAILFVSGAWICELLCASFGAKWPMLVFLLLPAAPLLVARVRKERGSVQFLPYPWLAGLGCSILTATLFALASFISYCAGAVQFDPTLAGLMAQLPPPGPMEAPDIVITHIPHAIGGIILFASILLGPTLYATLFLPWMILLKDTSGKSVIWGLGCSLALGPLAFTGFWGPASALAVLPGYLITLFALGWIARNLQTVLAAAFLGSFMAQAEGIWLYIFPAAVYPVGGRFGLCAALLWAMTATATTFWLRRAKP